MFRAFIALRIYKTTPILTIIQQSHAHFTRVCICTLFSLVYCINELLYIASSSSVLNRSNKYGKNCSLMSSAAPYNAYVFYHSILMSLKALYHTHQIFSENQINQVLFFPQISQDGLDVVKVNC